jgi:hypothetical protein
MTKPMTKSILTAGTLALAIATPRVGPAPCGAAPSTAAASTAPVPGDGEETLARTSGSPLAGVGAGPQDDGSDSGDQGDGGDDDDADDD